MGWLLVWLSEEGGRSSPKEWKRTLKLSQISSNSVTQEERVWKNESRESEKDERREREESKEEKREEDREEKSRTLICPNDRCYKYAEINKNDVISRLVDAQKKIGGGQHNSGH